MIIYNYRYFDALTENACMRFNISSMSHHTRKFSFPLGDIQSKCVRKNEIQKVDKTIHYVVTSPFKSLHLFTIKKSNFLSHL